MTYVVTSPIRRALESAEVVCEFLHVPVSEHEGFREREWATWEGKQVINYTRAKAISSVRASSIETRAQVETRALQAIEQLERAQLKSVAVITHEIVIQVLLQHADFNLEGIPGVRPVINHCSLSVVSKIIGRELLLEQWPLVL